MRAKVYNILPTQHRALSALYESIIHMVSAQYGRVPDVMAVEKALYEVEETHPELRANGADIQALPAPMDEAESEQMQRWWDAVKKAMAAGVNPSEDESVLQILEEVGATSGRGEG